MKLLPCPFCGGEPEEDGGMFFEFYGHERQDYSIACKKCGAEVCCNVGDHEGADVPCSCHHDTRKICAEKWNQRDAMLQGAEQQQNEPQNIPENIPSTQFKPVADLYGISVPGGRVTTYSTDAAEASDCRVMGWDVQEYVKLERYQNAALQGAEHDFREISNSSTKHFRENAETSTKCWCHTCRPVTISDMRFVVCPDCGNKRCPHANDHRNACTGSNEQGQEGSAYPAAPQQEVK